MNLTKPQREVLKVAQKRINELEEENDTLFRQLNVLDAKVYRHALSDALIDQLVAAVAALVRVVPRRTTAGRRATQEVRRIFEVFRLPLPPSLKTSKPSRKKKAKSS